MQHNVIQRQNKLYDRLMTMEVIRHNQRTNELIQLKKRMSELDEDQEALKKSGLNVDFGVGSIFMDGRIVKVSVSVEDKTELCTVGNALEKRGFEYLHSWNEDAFLMVRDDIRLTIEITQRVKVKPVQFECNSINTFVSPKN